MRLLVLPGTGVVMRGWMVIVLALCAYIATVAACSRVDPLPEPNITLTTIHPMPTVTATSKPG